MQDSHELPESIVRKLLSLMRYSHRLGHRLHRDYGISGRRLSVMRYLAENGEHSVSEVSRYLNLRDGTVSPLLESMVQDGLLTKRRCPNDSRKVLLTVTEHGREVAAQAPLTVFGQLRRELPTLTQEELQAIDDAMSRIIELAALDQSLLE
jgi:DNA-binding MarR family transcriptional regulator